MSPVHDELDEVMPTVKPTSFSLTEKKILDLPVKKKENRVHVCPYLRTRICTLTF